MVAPLRNTLLQVNNLTGIRSRARDEAAVLYLDFPFGTDPDLAFIEVNEKIDRAMGQLPREVERPRVLATDVSDIPVVQLSVTLKPLAANTPTPPTLSHNNPPTSSSLAQNPDQKVTPLHRTSEGTRSSSWRSREAIGAGGEVFGATTDLSNEPGYLEDRD